MTARPLFLALAILPVVGARLNAQILPPGATPTQVATGYRFTEGPLYDRAGGVMFSDLDMTHVQSRIYRYDIAGGSASVVDIDSGGTNGTYLDNSGRLITADRDLRQISKRSATDLAVVETALTTQFNGSPYNGPNDLVIDSAGGIYFTDPDYENRRSQPDGFYYMNPQGAVTLISSSFRKPNGVILSPNGTTLYLALENEKRIMAYDVGAGGALTNVRQFVRTDVNPNGTTIPGITNGPDGLTVDPAGNIYAAVQNAVWAWDPAGTRLFALSFPEDPTNVDFGGADGKTLYVTAKTSLYAVALNVLPTPTVGDLDDDGDVDAADIDWLWRKVRYGIDDPSANDVEDLSGDGLVNEDDVDNLLASKMTAGSNLHYGDANLSGGTPELTDYNLWRTGTGGWAGGDFDGSGGVPELNDYNLWRTGPTQFPTTVGSHGPGFGTSAQPSGAPGGGGLVPEPSSLFLAAIACCQLVVLRRLSARRRSA